MFRILYIGNDPTEYDRICKVLGQNNIKFRVNTESIEKGFAGNEQVYQVKVKNRDYENAEYLIRS